jgi:hypothetical protein
MVVVVVGVVWGVLAGVSMVWLCGVWWWVSLGRVMRGYRGFSALCVLVLVLVLVLVVAGCGGSSGHVSLGGGAGGGEARLVGRGPVGGLVVPEPGGGVQSGGVVARVGQFVVSRSAFEARLRIEALGDVSGQGVVPVPPAFVGCVSRLAVSLRTAAGVSPAAAVLKEDCGVLYDGLRSRVLGSLISDYWVIGGALEQGISVPDERIRAEFDALKGPDFRTEAAFRRFLAQTGESAQDLMFNIKEQVLEGALRGKVEASAGPVTPARIARYYQKNKKSYMVAEQRSLGMIHTKTLAEARRVKRELLSGVSFATISKRLTNYQPYYMRDGLFAGLEPHVFREAPLNDAIFSARPHVISGPVRLELGPAYDLDAPHDIEDLDGYYVFEVQSVTPAHQQTLAQVRASIAQMLPVLLQREAVAAFIAGWRRKWRAKTICSPGYVVRKCREFKPTPGETEDAYTFN